MNEKLKIEMIFTLLLLLDALFAVIFILSYDYSNIICIMGACIIFILQVLLIFNLLYDIIEVIKDKINEKRNH